MTVRALVSLTLGGAAAYFAWRLLNEGAEISEPAAVGDLAPGTEYMPTPDPIAAYLNRLGKIEGGGDLYAKNPKSSASGLYQFVKDTWLALGGSWGTEPDKPFGGLKPSETEQTLRAAKFTDQNVGMLSRAGITASAEALYAAHFLGASTAITVLLAPAARAMVDIVSPAVIKANPFLRAMTVADFRAWLTRKVGG